MCFQSIYIILSWKKLLAVKVNLSVPGMELEPLLQRLTWNAYWLREGNTNNYSE